MRLTTIIHGIRLVIFFSLDFLLLSKTLLADTIFCLRYVTLLFVFADTVGRES